MWYKAGESDSDLDNQEDAESGSANQPSGKQGLKIKLLTLLTNHSYLVLMLVVRLCKKNQRIQIGCIYRAV